MQQNWTGLADDINITAVAPAGSTMLAMFFYTLVSGVNLGRRASTPARRSGLTDYRREAWRLQRRGWGDIDGDGHEDVLVGAPWTRFSTTATDQWDPHSGEVYVVKGPVQSEAEIIRIKPTDRDEGLPVPSTPYPQSAMGACVAGAGDVNGDGYADFLIGAPWGMCDSQAWKTQPAAGEVYLVYGKSGFDGTIQPGHADSEVVFEGIAAGDNTGKSVAPAGDFDGDGYADF
jgi:hypothetical protein